LSELKVSAAAMLKKRKISERIRGRFIITRTDPAQKRIQVSDRSRGEVKILEPSSISQIYLWSKSQISHKQCQIGFPDALAV